MSDLRLRVEHALKNEIAPALLLDGAGIEVLDVAQHCVLLKAGQVWAAGPSEKFAGNELLVAGYVGE